VKRIWRNALLVVAFAGLLPLLGLSSVAGGAVTGKVTSQSATVSTGSAAKPDAVVATSEGSVKPEGRLHKSTLSRQQQEAILLRQLENQEAADHSLAAHGSTANLVTTTLTPTGRNDGSTSESLLIRRNNKNTRASQVSSTLAEPAAANEGFSVLYTGNTYASFSNDAGVTWTGIGLPAGHTDAPNQCCDQDVVRAHSKDRIFSSLLYRNSTGSNGGVRIFVRNSPSSTPLCTYWIDPAGTADNIMPDYPHIGLSSNFLYLTTNNLQNGTTWVGAQVRRFNLSQMSACQTTSFNTFTRSTGGQRVFTPVEGAQNSTTMYWAAIETTSSLRIFRWPESTTSVSQFVRGLSLSSNFTNPDCRGGTGNFDFIERTTSWSAAGFRMRGAAHGSRVTWFWNVNRDSAHAQAYVHGASFRLSDLALMEEPLIFNQSFCFGYPVVGGNGFGDLGISIAAGGRAGGGGTAAQGYVGVDDTPADPIHFGTVILTAQGTHNRSDGRYGDYFTVRPNARCQAAYVGTNYALLNGNTSSSNVNARYVEFGSSLDSSCF
jgi:hypothetical protein